MLSHIGLAVFQPERVKPFVKGVIKTVFQTAFAHSLTEVSEQIAPGTNRAGVPGPFPGAAGFFAGPERETFVMLRSGNYIFCSRTLKNVRPLVGIKQFGS